MIDTLQKRAASASFGFMPGAGTRPPAGLSDAFRRGMTLSIYHIERILIGVPVIGWDTGRVDRVFRVGFGSRVFNAGHSQRVFVIPEKRP